MEATNLKQPEKNQQWVFGETIALQPANTGINKKILAFCNEMMCVENHFEKGAVGPVHNHPHTQITYIVDGEFEFTIGSETKIVRKGDTLLKQNGVMHGCVCLEKGMMLDFFTPMRDEFVNL